MVFLTDAEQSGEHFSVLRADNELEFAEHPIEVERSQGFLIGFLEPYLRFRLFAGKASRDASPPFRLIGGHPSLPSLVFHQAIPAVPMR